MSCGLSLAGKPKHITVKLMDLFFGLEQSAGKPKYYGEAHVFILWTGIVCRKAHSVQYQAES